MSDEPVAPLEEIARGFDAETLEDAVLVVNALGIPYELVDVDDGVALVVPQVHAEAVRRELAQLDEEKHEAKAPTLRGGARAAIPAALALVAGHAWLSTLPAAKRAAIYAAGELDAARVHAGEVWRSVTALCLHADPAHVAGNALATAIFVSAAGDWIGPGFAIFLTVLAGAFGNALAAWLDVGHRAIGFSTATFGALGLSAVFGFVARYRDRIARRRAWLVLGAGVALLAMLGAGERSDLLAHIMGLAAGAFIGFLVSRSEANRQPSAVNEVGYAMLTVVLIAGSWAFALRAR